MTDHDEPQYRQHYRAHPDDIQYREVEDAEDGLFEVRMPIASTGEVRNEGDDPLTRDEIEGMARQINEQDVGVFLSHGRSSAISAARFDQIERLGNWQEAEVVPVSDRSDREDGADLLEATAVMMDPDTLPNIGPIRNALGTIKEQAKRDIGISSSIGWAENEAAPGGNDLMEASIVGIPADPRTVTQGAAAEAVARAAVEAGADAEALVETVRAAVMGPDADTDNEQMSDPDDPESDAENEASDTDEEQAEEERQETPEWAADLRDLLEDMNDTLGTVADAVRQDDDDEEEEDDEDENETDDDESAADEPDDEQDGSDEIDDLRKALDTLREGGLDVSDVELPEPADEQDADEADAERTGETDQDEDAAKAVLRS